MQQEIWKDIKGYEGLYQVSNLGNVKSLNWRKRGFSKLLTPKKNNQNRLWVELRKDGNKKQMLIHRLVGIAFISNKDNLPEINHKDFNTLNNRVENLEWCSREYNLKHYIQSEKFVKVTEQLREKYKNTPRKHNKYKTTILSKNGDTHIKVKQLTISNKYIDTWDNSITITHTYNYKQSAILECCRGKRKTAYGYKWQFAI